MLTLKGECLCGKIKYEHKGFAGTIVHCHCSMCRKWHGAAFRSRIVIERKGFQWISGQEFLSNYNASENVTKCFCKNCGSNLISQYNYEKNETLGLPLGGVEGHLTSTDQIHIFTKDKASWFEINDEYTQFPGRPDNLKILREVN